jgi:hypothetical protein
MPSLPLERVAVTKTLVSPDSIKTQPPAWGANNPTLSRISRPSKDIDLLISTIGLDVLVFHFLRLDLLDILTPISPIDNFFLVISDKLTREKAVEACCSAIASQEEVILNS